MSVLPGGAPAAQISVTTGESSRNVQELTRRLSELTRQFADLAKQAEVASRSVTSATRGSAAARPVGAGQSWDEQLRQADQWGQKAAQAFGRALPSHLAGPVTSPGVPGAPGVPLQPRLPHQAARQQAARGRLNAQNVAQALGWIAPGGQGVYYGQQAAEALGIGGRALLGGTLAGVAVAGGLALGDYTATQEGTGRMLAAVAGTTPGGVGAVDQAVQLQRLQAQYNLTDQQGQGIVQGLAAGGLPHDQDLGPAFQLAANAVQVFRLDIGEATRLVSASMVDLGRTSDQTAAFLMTLARAGAATGTPVASLGKLAAENPDLLATVTNGDIGPLLTSLRQVGGSDETAAKLGQGLSGHGFQTGAFASMLGISEQQFDTMRTTPKGAADLADLELGLLRHNVAAQGMDHGFATTNLEYQAVGNPTYTYAEATRLLGQGPAPFATAYQQTIDDEKAAAVRRQANLDTIHTARGLASAGIDAEAAGTLDTAPGIQNPTLPTTNLKRHVGIGFGSILPALQELGDFLTNPYAGISTMPSGRPSNPGDLVDAAIAASPLPGRAADLGAELAQTGHDVSISGLAQAAADPSAALAAALSNIRVSGAAQLVVRVENGGRASFQTITIPLANGDQAHQQYLPGGRSYTPGTPGPR